MRLRWSRFFLCSLGAALGATTALAQGRPPSDPARAELDAAAAWEVAPQYAPAPAPATQRGPRAIVYSSNFDGDNGGLTASLDWEWGPTYAWTGANCTGTFVNPTAAHSGTGMWGTVLNGCYHNLGNNQGSASGGACNNTNPSDDNILSLTVDLTNYADATLTFWEWYDVFSYFDWTEVRVNGTSALLHCESSYVAPSAWVQRTVNLNAYVGGVTTIAFHMMASTVVEKSGWYIDDLEVTGTPVPVELQTLSIE